MLISEKQKTMSWQVRTKDGVYCQPESLSMFYMWVFENRISADDFVFNVKVNDWIPLVNMQELLYCFWQLLSSENVIYGPISTGELKQLYVNNQISQGDKISLYRQDVWKEIKDIPALSNWLEQKDTSEMDYIQFIEKINDEFTLAKSIVAEEKIDKKAYAFKRENAEQKKLIKELGSVKSRLEKDLSAKSRELEALTTNQNEYKRKYDSAREELQAVQKELQEKTAVTEQLNKNIAQAEVTRTLKDDEVDQLRSSIKKLQDELAQIHEAGNNQLSSADEVNNLNTRINELRDKNEELTRGFDNFRNLADEKEKLAEEFKANFNKLNREKEDLAQKISALQDAVSEKEKLLDKLNVSSSEYTQQLKEDLNAKEVEISDIQKILSNKNESIALAEDAITKLRDELQNKESEIVGLQKMINEKDGVAEGKGAELGKLESIIQEKVNETARLQDVVFAKDEEISGYKESLAKLQSELTEKEIETEEAKGLNVEVVDLKTEVDSYKQKVGTLNNSLQEKDALIIGIEDDKKNLNSAINELNQKIINLSSEYDLKAKGFIDSAAEKDREYQNKLDEKTQEWEETLNKEKASHKKGLQELENTIQQKDAQIEGVKQEINRLQDVISIQKKEFQSELDDKSNAWDNTLRTERDSHAKEAQDLRNIIQQNDAKTEAQKQEIEKLQDAISAQKNEFQNKLEQESNKWDDKLKSEKENHLKEVHELKGVIQQNDTQVEAQKQEIKKLQDAILSQNIAWREKLQEAEKEISRVTQEAEKQKEEMRLELTQRLKEFIDEKDELQNNIKRINEANQKLIEERDALEREIAGRGNDIQSIKEQANKQEEIYHIEIHELEAENKQYGHNAVLMRKHVEELEGKLQDSIASGESLRHDMSVLNEELDGARKANDQIKKERDSYILQLNNVKEEFSQAKFELERELEQLRHNIQHVEEENRNAQKQFYLEKQKLTKEYTETISKQEKLFKRAQLEREIQDRSKIKEEMDRLYNLLKESFEGIQKGTAEIQASLQNIGADIDDKKLSLKYISEAEKREEKKVQFSKGEQLGESETVS